MPGKKPDGTISVPWHRSLLGRALLVMAVGAIVMVGGVGYQASIAAEELIEHLLQDRQDVAESAASHLDRELGGGLATLRRAASRALATHAAPERLARALADASQATPFARRLLLLDAQGELVVAPPEIDRASVSATLVGQGLLEAARKSPAVSRLDTQGLLLFVAAIESRGQHAGWVGAAVDPRQTDLLGLIGIEPHTGPCEVIDAGGMVVGSTWPEGLLRAADHDETLAAAIAEKRGLRGRCHTCHAQDGRPAKRRVDILAFVPLRSLALGVAIRQPEQEALAPALALRRRLLICSLLLALAFLVAGLVAVRSVVAPLSRLSTAISAPGAEDLEAPLPEFSNNEVGALAAALAGWRARLARISTEKRQQELRREALGRALDAQEQERCRVARELHDTVSQDLAAIRLQLERLSAQKDREEAGEQARALERQVQALLATVRRITLDLRPLLLDKLGFLPALERQIERLGRETEIRGRLVVDGDERPLGHAVSVSLFRVFQECLTNIERHSGAQHVIATLSYEPRSVSLTVEDDGRGFERAEVVALADDDTRGLGLLGVEERAKLLGGEVAIESAPGEGTMVRVTLPHQPPSDVVEDRAS